MANGHLERVFSQLKLIKNNHRTSFNENTLDQLLQINLVGPPLADWDATGAIELWWREKKTCQPKRYWYLPQQVLLLQHKMIRFCNPRPLTGKNGNNGLELMTE